jgi:hypothetical protein
MLPRLLVLAVLVAACSSGTGTTTATREPASSTTAAPSTTATPITTTTRPPSTIASEDVPLVALFLAAVEDGLAGSSYEGAAVDDPEGFLATAALFCELLEEGLSGEEVLTAYIAALTAQDRGGQISDDDLLLGGVVLGAGVEVLCPEFSDRLEM